MNYVLRTENKRDDKARNLQVFTETLLQYHIGIYVYVRRTLKYLHI